jgi:hypothetical protein
MIKITGRNFRKAFLPVIIIIACFYDVVLMLAHTPRKRETPVLIDPVLGIPNITKVATQDNVTSSRVVVEANETEGKPGRRDGVVTEQLGVAVQKNHSETKDRSRIKDFERQDGVVIAAKIHGHPESWDQVKQSLCLFHGAYNKRLLYDHVVFTSFPIPPNEQQKFRDIVAPAKLTIVNDTRDIQEELADLTPAQQVEMERRCKKNLTDITFGSRCPGKLAYNWQAEFRSKQIWMHEALQPYKYMLWLDSDAFCTQTWKQDPIAVMVRNDLVLMFDNFPAGSGRGEKIHKRIRLAFNQTLCKVWVQDGHLTARTGNDCRQGAIHLVHGFFHITNLDFFRGPIYQQWANVLIGDGKYQRQFDDQIAVTVPAAILAPERSWDMYSHNITLNVFHNTKIDGKAKAGGYKNWWRANAESLFPEAKGVCDSFIKIASRY